MEWGQMARSCVRKRERDDLSLFLYNIPHKRFGLLQFRLRLIQKKDFPPKPRVLVHVSDTRCVICK